MQLSSVETGNRDSIGAGDGGAGVSDSEGNSFRSVLSVSDDTVGGAASPSLESYVSKRLRNSDLDELLRTPVSPQDKRALGRAEQAAERVEQEANVGKPVPSQRAQPWVTATARAVPDAKCGRTVIALRQHSAASAGGCRPIQHEAPY